MWVISRHNGPFASCPLYGTALKLEDPGFFKADESLVAAFDNRYAGEGGARAFAAAKDKITNRIRAALGPRYDEAATADREAITAFVRGERSRPEAPPMRDLTNASDRDFKKEIGRWFDPSSTRIG